MPRLFETGNRGIIPCSGLPQTSNNIIQKGLAFGRDWSGSVVQFRALRGLYGAPADRRGHLEFVNLCLLTQLALWQPASVEWLFGLLGGVFVIGSGPQVQSPP